MMNKRYLITLMIGLILSSCGGGESMGTTSGGSLSSSNETALTPSGAKTVAISPISKIPTNGGISQQFLTVHNNTGEVIYLDSYKVSGSSKAGLTDRIHNQVSHIVGGAGYDSRVGNAQACGKVSIGETCSVPFTPDGTSGASAIQMNFKTASNKTFSAAQEITYAALETNKSNGFIVSNDGITNVHSTNSYSLTIPFIAADKYNSVEVNSSVTPLSMSSTCGSGAIMEGAHCSVTLNMPAAPLGSSYANTITLTGTTDTGKRVVSLRSGATGDEIGLLTVSNSTEMIQSNDKNEGKIILTNIGSKDVINVTSLLTKGENSLNSKDSLIELKSISCDINGQNTDFVQNGSIPNGVVCEAKVSVKDLTAAGYDKFGVSYTGGSNNTTMSRSTLVYYSGKYVNNNASYDLTPDLAAFDNVLFSPTNTGEVIGSITVKNTGQEKLTLGKLRGLSFGGEFSIKGSSTCSEGKTLEQTPANNSCTFQIGYKPTAATAERQASLYVEVKDAKGNSVIPQKYVAFTYSAKLENVTGQVVFTPPSFALLVRNDKKSSYKKTVRIQAFGTPYTIKSINIVSGNLPSGNAGNLKIQALAKLNVEGVNLANPLSGTTFTNGESSAVNKIIQVGEAAELVYFYESASDLVNESVTQLFTGILGSGKKSLNNLVINYTANATDIVQDNPPVDPLDTSLCPEGKCAGLALVDGTKDIPKFKSVLASGSSFPLLKSNMLRATFIYSNGDTDKDGFYVDDSEIIPYGFKIGDTDAGDACPTTAQTATKLKAGNKCKVVYYFLDKSFATNQLSYTQAANGLVKEISMPPYIFIDKKGESVKADLSQRLTFIAEPFNDSIYAGFKELNNLNDNVSHKSTDEAVYELRFSATYKESGLNSPIMVKLNQEDGLANGIRPVEEGGSLNCNIILSESGFCSIQVIAPKNRTTIGVTYAFSNAPDYEVYRGEITIYMQDPSVPPFLCMRDDVTNDDCGCLVQNDGSRRIWYRTASKLEGAWLDWCSKTGSYPNADICYDGITPEFNVVGERLDKFNKERHCGQNTWHLPRLDKPYNLGSRLIYMSRDDEVIGLILALKKTAKSSLKDGLEKYGFTTLNSGNYQLQLIMTGSPMSVLRSDIPRDKCKREDVFDIDISLQCREWSLNSNESDVTALFLDAPIEIDDNMRIRQYIGVSRKDSPRASDVERYAGPSLTATLPK